jgi:hypothetical protein
MSLSPDMKAERLTYDPEYVMHMSAIRGKADITNMPGHCPHVTQIFAVQGYCELPEGRLIVVSC